MFSYSLAGLAQTWLRLQVKHIHKHECAYTDVHLLTYMYMDMYTYTQSFALYKQQNGSGSWFTGMH